MTPQERAALREAASIVKANALPASCMTSRQIAEIKHADTVLALLDEVDALRAALDAALRERAMLHEIARNEASDCTKAQDERDAADATGYARGVRNAAAKFSGPYRLDLWTSEAVAAAILALLPANKETNDAE
jgi:hypothetical protein